VKALGTWNRSTTTPFEDGQTSPAILRDWREVPSEALERKEVRQIAAGGHYQPPRQSIGKSFVLRDVEELNNVETAAALSIHGRKREGAFAPRTPHAAKKQLGALAENI